MHKITVKPKYLPGVSPAGPKTVALSKRTPCAPKLSGPCRAASTHSRGREIQVTHSLTHSQWQHTEPNSGWLQKGCLGASLVRDKLETPRLLGPNYRLHCVVPPRELLQTLPKEETGSSESHGHQLETFNKLWCWAVKEQWRCTHLTLQLRRDSAVKAMIPLRAHYPASHDSAYQQQAPPPRWVYCCTF